MAASSFLCLARPTDRRVPAWLARALEFADAAGDRSRQLGTLTTLAWHHFIRSLWGTARDTAEAEGFALRLAELGEELGAIDMAVHGRSLLAIMARFSGRLDDAAAPSRGITAVQRLGRRRELSLDRVGRHLRRGRGPGCLGARPSRRTRCLPRPRRRDGAARHRDGTDRGRTGRGGVGALRRRRPARPGALRRPRRRAQRTGPRARGTEPTRRCPGSNAPPLSARALEAPPAIAAAAALRAEITGDMAGLPPPRPRPRASARRWSCGPMPPVATWPRSTPCAAARRRSACPVCSSGSRHPSRRSPRGSGRQLASDASCPTMPSVSLCRIGNDPPQWGQRM